RLVQLNEIRDKYNTLRDVYVFPANSVNSTGGDVARVDQRSSILREIEPITESNFISLIAEIGTGLNQMRYLRWPSKLQHLYRRNPRYENKPNPINLNQSAFIGENDWERELQYATGGWRSSSYLKPYIDTGYNTLESYYIS